MILFLLLHFFCDSIEDYCCCGKDLEEVLEFMRHFGQSHFLSHALPVKRSVRESRLEIS